MSDLHQKLVALSQVASQISSDEDIDALLPDLIRAACEQGGWDRGTVMSIDLEHGYAQVLTRYETSMLPRALENRWELATSPSLVALKQGAPVYIRDALQTEEFPGYRREAQEHGYRSVLILPMNCLDEEHRPLVLTVASRAVRDVGEDVLTFMTASVHLGAIAIERAHRHRVQQRNTQRLQQGLEAQRSLLRDVLAGKSLENLISSLRELLNGAVLVIDFAGNSVLASRSSTPGELDDDAWSKTVAGTGAREIVVAVREALEVYRKTTVEIPVGMKKQTVTAAIEPLTVDKELVGALLTVPEGKVSDFQQIMLENARFALSVHLMRSVIRFRVETRTLNELFFEIVERRWKVEDDIVSRSRRAGLPVGSPMQMIVIDFPTQPTQESSVQMECRAIAELVAKQLRVAMSMVTLGSGLVCVVQRDEKQDPALVARLTKQIATDLSKLISRNREPIVVLGAICNSVDQIATDWERCWRVIRIAHKFGRSGVLDIPSLGALPLLAGLADSVELSSFVEGAIGMLIDHDRHSTSCYLETLEEYMKWGCRSQPCADAMGLHVTTLRYRLGKIKQLCGVDFEAPDKRFAVELAIQLFRLTGAGKG